MDASSLLMENSVRVAVVQASSVIFDTPATIDKASGLVSDAASKGAKLIVFPEAFIGGYPYESTEDITKDEKYYDAAIDVPGPEVDSIATIARKNSVYLVLGVIERASYCLYSTALIFDPLGLNVGKHRKLIRTIHHSNIWKIGEELTIPVHKTEYGKIGAIISWENRVPLLRTTLYDKGVQIYCALSLDTKEVWQSSMKHIAVEGGCFVLAANQFCRKKDYSQSRDHDIIELDNENSLDSVVCAGGSVIVSPSGVVLAGPNFKEETLLFADLDLRECLRAKLEFDVVCTTNKWTSLLLQKKRRI